MKDAPLTWYDVARRTGPVYALARKGYRISRRVFFDGLRKSIPAACSFGPPRGTFSVLKLVKEKRVKGQILQEATPAPSVSKTSLRALAQLGQDKLGSWPVFWSLHQEAHLVGKSLALMDAQKRLAEESIYAPYSVRREPSFHALRFPEPVRLHGNWTSVVSQWSSGFYHWFMDVLPRLSYLSEYPSDTKILVPYPVASYQEETLRMMGLEGRYRPTQEEHLLVENYYFSSPTTMTGGFDPYAVNFLRKTLLPKADNKGDFPTKFYLQRVGRARGVRNEEEVVQFFIKRGWAIVDTERLPMAKQIQLFARAEAVCALHGAGLTNILWCGPKCKIFELVASTYMNGVYEGLSSIVGVDYDFLVCKADASFKAYVDLKELEKFIPS